MAHEKKGELVVRALESSKIGFIITGCKRAVERFVKGLWYVREGVLHDDTNLLTPPDTKKDYVNLFIMLVGTTVLTYVLALASVAVQTNAYPSDIFSSWHQYDSDHYVNIAKMGYGRSEDQRVLIVFFPLYPTLIKLLNYVFHSYLAASLFIANVAYLFAGLYFYKLVRLDYSKDVALRTVFYFSIFPTAYFLRAAYTESLFIALAVMSLYYARKDKWLLACIFGGLLSATRITGMFILPALILEYFQQRKWKLSNVDNKVFYLFIVPIGLIWYFGINIYINGNPFSFLALQREVWNKAIASPWKGFLGAIGWFGDWVKPEQSIIVAWSESLAGGGGFFLVLWLLVKYRPAYGTFCALSWILMTSTEFWLSLPRYTLAMFPIFIIFAKWGRNRAVDYLITFVFIYLFATFMPHFIQARWAF